MSRFGLRQDEIDEARKYGLTDQQMAESLAALDAAEARHGVETMVDHGSRGNAARPAACGGSTLRVPPRFAVGETFQANGKTLTCNCGFVVSTFPDGSGRFAVLLSSDGEDTAPHTLGTREAADRCALSVAARHSEACGKA